MNEKETQKILKYYLEYEIYNILNSASIKIDKSNMILKNTENKNICKHFMILKENKIEKEIEKVIGKQVYNKENVIKQICSELRKIDEDGTNREQVSIKIKNILKENTNIKQKTITNFINNICDIQGTQEFWLYADNITDSTKKLKLPIFIFKCKLENNKIDIVEANINSETIKKAISIIQKKEFSEVAIEYEETILRLSNEISETIDGGDIQHLLDLYYTMIEETLEISKRDIENIGLTNKIYKINKEYIISLKELAIEGAKNIREDIELLIKIIEHNNYVPTVLNKYLNDNMNEKKDISNSKYIKPYKGNYKSDYGVGQVQYKIVNAIKDNELIAIEGPPGTGKTSLLKEIIANNIVERANLILENWNSGLTENKYNSTTYYDIDWYKSDNKVIKSTVVSSKNGEAIENVGKEINKEIRYMYPIARKYKRIELLNNEKQKVLQQYKGIVCLPLGKKDNIECFKEFLYENYIPRLEKIKKNGNLDKYCEQVKKRYEEKLKLVKLEEQLINKIQPVEKVCIEDKQIKEEILELREKEKCENIENKKINLKQINLIENKLKNIENQLKDIQKNIAFKENEIKELQEQNNRFENISKNIISKILNYKFYKENRNIDYENKISEINIQIETEKIRITELIKDENKLKEQKSENIYDKEKLDDQELKLDEEIKNLKKQVTRIMLVEKFNEKNKKEFWKYKDIIDIYGHSYLNILNQELFELALKLNEAYVLKNIQEIIENLKIFLQNEKYNNICSKFYDSTNIYNEKKQEAIKSIWNTVFLCFPVITTTLDSFYQKCFQLLPEYIDLTLIDEAGQILPHNVVTALYRSKKAVIVGDINQIEPIYNITNKKFDKNEQEIGNRFNEIKIEENSVQHIANKKTDIISNDETIILKEHYRCEKNIVEFANKNVYQNRLIINKNDNMNKPFNNNMVALDVRGKKEENQNINRLEAESCIEAIKYIIEHHKGEEKPSISVITPFKKQKSVIENKLEEAKINNVKVGTVHAFQGQQKDYIIFSQVVDSLNDKHLINFIGRKCNMLNVAVTRAKKQFIFLGNLDLASKSGNFTTKLVEYIKENGIVYSLYDSENNIQEIDWDDQILSILQPGLVLEDDDIGKYIYQNFRNGILSDAKQHYEFLKYAVKNAKSEIYIMSPWFRDNVLNEEFIDCLKKLNKNKCKIKINFGYQKGNSEVRNAKELVEELARTNSLGFLSSELAEEIINKMYNSIGKENFIYAPPTHAKVLIIDGKYMCIGSHNWLSNAGNTVKSQRAKEVSIVTTNLVSINYTKEQLFV